MKSVHRRAPQVENAALHEERDTMAQKGQQIYRELQEAPQHGDRLWHPFLLQGVLVVCSVSLVVFEAFW